MPDAGCRNLRGFVKFLLNPGGLNTECRIPYARGEIITNNRSLITYHLVLRVGGSGSIWIRSVLDSTILCCFFLCFGSSVVVASENKTDDQQEED